MTSNEKNESLMPLLILGSVIAIGLVFLLFWPEPEAQKKSHKQTSKPAKPSSNAKHAQIALVHAAQKYGVNPLVLLAIARLIPW